jgi:hypothetical protein
MTRRLRRGVGGEASPPIGASRFDVTSPLVVCLAYVLLTVAMTWPLAAGLARDVPGDLGDSLLNMWILGWGAEQVPRLVLGQESLRDYWNANIFHPEPLALGFSEHLFGLVIQILPVYWLTGNLILSYNLLFLSSFALSGLGMFLLVRDLLADPEGRGAGDRRRAVILAAFIAGAIFAFIPFRIAQVAHIQSLHAQWMPFALVGFHRFIAYRRRTALAVGTAALLMQNWSNGYYLIYFAPFVPAFVIHQMWTWGRLRDLRAWFAFAAAAVVVALGTAPFLWLYLETARVHAFERPLGEIVAFSADVYSYFTAPEALRVWGRVMRAFPKPEGELFFGVVPALLAAAAVLSAMRGPGRESMATTRRGRVLTLTLLAIIAIQTIGLVAMVLTGGFITSIAGVPIRATNAPGLAATIAIVSGILLALSPEARRRAISLARSPVTFCVLAFVIALWLSLGPVPASRGRALSGMGLYGVLYDHVPGFAGLRVPARFAMIAAVFLSVAAGAGALALLRRGRAVAIAVVLVAACLVEVSFAPMPLNLTWGGAAVTPPGIVPGRDAPPVYHTVARLRDDAVIAEFPFGDPAWELRYVYYSTVHWKRLVNGYSGGFPTNYKTRVALLQRVADYPDAAWRALRDAGTTHVIVHDRAFPPGEAGVIAQWLQSHFAVEIARFDDARLFDVTGVWPPAL